MYGCNGVRISDLCQDKRQSMGNYVKEVTSREVEKVPVRDMSTVNRQPQ